MSCPSPAFSVTASPSVVDDIGVVAEAALHLVGAAPAVETIGGGVADEAVGDAVAGGVDCRGSGEGQILDIRRERVRGRGQDRVVTVAGELGDGVADVVDDVGVVAAATVHRIGADAAIEAIVAGAAPEIVVALPPFRSSLPEEPSSWSSSPPPLRVSLPFEPLRRLAKPSPVMVSLPRRRRCSRRS